MLHAASADIGIRDWADPISAAVGAGVEAVGQADRPAADLAASVPAAVASAVAERDPVGEMRTHHFLRRLDHKRIVQAIKKAEGKSSGQIRVFIQRGKFEGDALPRAERKFFQLGMQKTTNRNAVLIFVAPREQKYAVFGDVGSSTRTVVGTGPWKIEVTE